MQIQKSKRGISPVIATILLVVIAIALFGAVYVWISSMQKDAIIKFDTGIEQACLDINFNVIKETGTNNIQIQNRGEVALYRVQLYVKKGGSLDSLGTIPLESSASVIGQGESATGNFSGELSGCQQIKAVPVLLGISKKTGTEKEYICTDRAKTINCQ